MIFQDKTFACLTLVKRQSIILILSSKFYLRIRVTNKGYLNGQLLLAMPNITDPRFAKAVIYICTHTEDGAMGLIINKPCDNINFPNLLKQLSIQNIEKGISQKNLSQIPLHEGGPIEFGARFYSSQCRLCARNHAYNIRNHCLNSNDRHLDVNCMRRRSKRLFNHTRFFRMG